MVFSVPYSHESAGSIVIWWELRRIPYNIFVGCLGIISLILFFFFIEHSGQLNPGEDALEPLALIFAPLFINIAYTSGWIVEIILRKIVKIHKHEIGVLLLKAGVIFSIAVILFPSTIWGVIYLTKLL